jgi:hypothetical protein
MREIDFHEEFGAAFNWLDRLGYFSDADNLAVCQKIFRPLKRGGRFLVEGPNKPCMLANLCQQLEYTTGGAQVAHRDRWNARTNRAYTTWTLRRGERTVHHAVSLRIFNGSEMR